MEAREGPGLYRLGPYFYGALHFIGDRPPYFFVEPMAAWGCGHGPPRRPVLCAGVTCVPLLDTNSCVGGGGKVSSMRWGLARDMG